MPQEKTAPSLNYKRSLARIYNQSNKVIGAGFLAKGDYILTCAHVVRQALKKSAEKVSVEQKLIGQEVQLKFPFAKGSKVLSARVQVHVPQDDLAGLQLLDPVPSQAEAIAYQCSHSWEHNFSIVGFPDGAMVRWASGIFKDECPREDDDSFAWVQIEGTTTQGCGIKPGFSGAPIWNHDVAAVVGIAVARDKKEPDSKVAFMIPAKAFSGVKESFDRLNLLNLLQPYETVLKASIEQAYSLCYDRLWGDSSPKTLEDQIKDLQRNDVSEIGFKPLYRFVALLCLPEFELATELRQKLGQWLEKRIDDADAFALMESVRVLLSPKPSEISIYQESHLLIYVEDTSDDAKSVRVLFVPNAEQYDSRTGMGSDRILAPEREPFNQSVTLANLPALLRTCLNEALPKAIAQGIDYKNIVVHLLLPHTWLHQDCDRWSSTEPSALFAALSIPTEQTPIGDDFSVVVRISERLNPALPELFRQKWFNKWEALEKLNSRDCCTAFLSGEQYTGQSLIGALNQDCHLGLKRSTACPEPDQPALVGALLQTGTPAALLLRQDQFVESLVAADEIDRLLKDKINPLPEAVRRCRADSMGKPEAEHIGHHLLLLWENPHLIPTTTTAEMPQAS